MGILDPAARLTRYEQLFADRGAPFAFVDLDAMRANSLQMLERANGVPIRVASKSLRSAPIVRRILESDGRFRGQLTFTLPETLWLAEQGFRDLLLAYPCVDLEALAALAGHTAEHRESAPAIVVDSPAHLDLIDKVHGGGAPVRVAIDVDCAWWTAGDRVKLGPKRSPVHTPEQAVALAEEVEKRPQIELVGLMAYEGQIAGVADRPPEQRLRGAGIRWMQRRSAAELADRRAAIAVAVGALGELEFVNGGGTGSMHTTSKEEAVTDIAAGSGFYAPTLFDTYTSFKLEPAAIFALPIVRKPAPEISTALGGGYLASGVGAKDRMPSPYLPQGLRFDANEGAGEVQSPLLGKASRKLKVGDRVYFRHTKAGELCERFNSLLLIAGDQIVDEVPTYRGEGHAFL